MMILILWEYTIKVGLGVCIATGTAAAFAAGHHASGVTSGERAVHTASSASAPGTVPTTTKLHYS